MRMTAPAFAASPAAPEKPDERGLLARVASSLAQSIRQWRNRCPRRLRLLETLALGERRFVAVVECDERRYLIGGTAQTLTLLASLETIPQPEMAGSNQGSEVLAPAPLTEKSEWESWEN